MPLPAPTPSSQFDPQTFASSGDRSVGDVLFVDLDGTLIKTDSLCECLIQAVKYNPTVLCKLPLWLASGRARLKSAVAQAAQLDSRRLPFREDVLEFLHEQKNQGRTLVLATAAPESIAREVSDQLGLFDDVLSSDGNRNLKGHAKLSAVEVWCAAHGHETFSYVGDSHADLPIWRRASEVHVVEPGRRLTRALAEFGSPTSVFGSRQGRAASLLRALRPHQWVKNLLLFVPLVLSHEVALLDKLLAVILAFVAFCACASAVYLLNDLLDLDADRRHPVKRNRPFAAGRVPLIWGPPLSLGLLLFSFGLSAATLPAPFVAILLVYLVVTCLYSYWLKNTVMGDVLTLGGLYALRVLAGGLAANIEVSQWLMAFCLFLFTSLAFVKRHSELVRLAAEGQSSPNGRAYLVGDLRLIESLGPASGYLAVLVMALYINSDAMKAVYKSSWALWMICPLLMYWISRIWFLSVRGALPEDPVVFAMRDRVSLATIAIAGALLVIATIA